MLSCQTICFLTVKTEGETQSNVQLSYQGSEEPLSYAKSNTLFPRCETEKMIIPPLDGRCEGILPVSRPCFAFQFPGMLWLPALSVNSLETLCPLQIQRMISKLLIVKIKVNTKRIQNTTKMLSASFISQVEINLLKTLKINNS